MRGTFIMTKMVLSEKPVTAVFIDYENWFWTTYNKKANNKIDEVINEIKRDKGKIVHIVIYADFSQDLIQNEKMKLEKKYPRMVRDCGSYNSNLDKPNFRKNLTDFYLLDDIYQTLINNPMIQQFIIVSGDGHFHSVISHLRMFHEKRVGVFAIEGSLSHLIKETADWCIEVKPEVSYDFSKILSTLYNNQEREFPSYFSGSVTWCAKYFNIDKAEVEASLSYLVTNNYVNQEKRLVDGEGERRVLKVDWDKVENDGLWKRPTK